MQRQVRRDKNGDEKCRRKFSMKTARILAFSLVSLTTFTFPFQSFPEKVPTLRTLRKIFRKCKFFTLKTFNSLMRDGARRFDLKHISCLWVFPGAIFPCLDRTHHFCFIPYTSYNKSKQLRLKTFFRKNYFNHSFFSKVSES